MLKRAHGSPGALAFLVRGRYVGENLGFGLSFGLATDNDLGQIFTIGVYSIIRNSLMFNEHLR